MGEVRGLAHAIVAFGVGPVSYLEALWLLIGLGCLKDSVCLLIDARSQLAAAVGPARDQVEWWLAVMDHRGALAGVLVQVCFISMGVMNALRPPAPAAVTNEDAAVQIATIALLLGVQVTNLVAGRERHRYTRWIDAYPRAPSIPGGRRAYEQDPR